MVRVLEAQHGRRSGVAIWPARLAGDHDSRKDVGRSLVAMLSVKLAELGAGQPSILDWTSVPPRALVGLVLARPSGLALVAAAIMRSLTA